jgi:hypothetical protein
MKEDDYVIQLKRLVGQINSNVGIMESDTKRLLDEALEWDLPTKEEKKLLADLIERGKEYVQLKKTAYRQYLSEELFDKYFSLARWFKSLQMLLDTFDVPLRDVSFTDLSLKE